MKKSLLLIVTFLSFTFLHAQSPCQAGFSYQTNPGSNVVVLQGYAYNLIDSLPINVISWTWTVSNTTLSGQNVTYQFNSTGNYYVCLSILTDDSCSSYYCDTINAGTSNTCYLYVDGVVTNATTSSSNDGSIDITPYYGTVPYTYVWNNGTTLEDLTGLAPGYYEVIVTDAVNCTASQYFSVGPLDSLPQDTSLQVWVSTTNNTAAPGSLCNGTAYIEVYGGTPPYNYYMNNTTISSNYIEGLCAGTYTVVVTDASGVSITSTFVINDNGNTGDSVLYVNIYSGYSSNGQTCAGYAEADVWGGVAPYSYLWDNGETTNFVQDLCAGFYCVTVTDYNGQTASACVNITNYDSSYVYPEDTLNGQIDTCITTMIIDSAYVDSIYSNNTGVYAVWVLLFNGNIIYIYQEYVIDTPGTYLITLVINCNGAKSLITLSDVVTVTQEDLTITGITNPEKNQFLTLYPNPVKDVLNFNSSKTITEIGISDATGRIVSISENSTINFSNLTGGIYFVKITFNDNSSIVKKIIK